MCYHVKDTKQLLRYAEEAMKSEFHSYDFDTNEENIVFEKFESTWFLNIYFSFRGLIKLSNFTCVRLYSVGPQFTYVVLNSFPF